MRILILGGMGYIGSALADLYRDTPEHRVTLVDTKFVPERVAALPRHFRFIHADMADLALMRRLAAETDVMHLLAAQVEAETSMERSAAVWNDNFELPRQVVEQFGANTRVMFPSSCNVFGGVPEGAKWQGLTEEDTPSPKLPYAEAKREMEKFALASGRNIGLVRLGTNFGYAPGIRFNLVTNIFVKRAIEGLELKLHGGGLNWRPTACVQDCARALDFLGAHPAAAGEIFHVVWQAYRICDLAEIVVKTLGSPSPITNVDKAVPFSSYAPVADKIKKLGFQFAWPLERAITDLGEKLIAMRQLEAA